MESTPVTSGIVRVVGAVAMVVDVEVAIVVMVFDIVLPYYYE